MPNDSHLVYWTSLLRGGMAALAVPDAREPVLANTAVLHGGFGNVPFFRCFSSRTVA